MNAYRPSARTGSCLLTTFAAVLAVATLTLVSPPPVQAASNPALKCELKAEKALQKCIKNVTKASAKCFVASGVDCAADDAKVAKALTKTNAAIGKACPDDATVQAAGYGAVMTVAGLSERMQNACKAEAASIAARSFGGPQGAAFADTVVRRNCLKTAHKEGTKLLLGAAKTNSKCIAQQRKGKVCDTAKTTGKINKLLSKATAKIDAACVDPDDLQSIVALTTAQFLDRALDQAECVIAYGHPDTAPLTLACGPRASIPPLPRGVYTQVTLDEAEFGTRCGDGSPLSIWIRPAPVGQPIENVVFAMQGGGVCIFEADCLAVPPGLFESATDTPPAQGIMSNDPLVSPFANYTKVFVPYCTQDVFLGGGATSSFTGLDVNRFGAIDVRAALRYVRDLVWTELDANDPVGYHPRRMRVMFGGFSAGGFGTLYNYHYVLDDLQWDRTTAFPDAALALDNGTPLSIANLGALVIPDGPPTTALGWSALASLPPYCFTSNCGVGPVLMNATAPRLKEVPEQQFTILSNQVDDTQVSTTFFPDEPTWVNTMRQSYCDTKDFNGVNYFLTPVSTSIHVISVNDTRFTTLSVDGQTMQDWFTTLLADPNAVTSRVEEGSLVADIPGVDPFPCTVAP